MLHGLLLLPNDEYNMAGSHLSLSKKHRQKYTGARFTKGTEVMQNGPEVMCGYMHICVHVHVRVHVHVHVHEYTRYAVL